MKVFNKLSSTSAIHRELNLPNINKKNKEIITFSAFS